MDRNKRTAVVVLVAVLLASVASLGIYRVVSARPASEASAVKTVDVVVAQHPLPLGTRLTKDHVKLVKWPAETQVPGAFAKVDEVAGPRPDRDGRGERTADRGQAGAARGGGWPAALDSSGHARHLGQGQRSGRRGRLRRPRHARRRHGDADEPPGAAGKRDPRGRQQCPGAHRGHPLSTRRTRRTASRFPRPW